MTMTFILGLLLGIASLNILSSSSRELVFEYESSVKLQEEGKYIRILGDFTDVILKEGGAPELPLKRFLFAIPAGAKVSVNVKVIKSKKLKLKKKISPIPIYDRDGLVPLLIEDKKYYKEEKFIPPNSYGKLKEGILRNLRYGELPLYPVSYNPSNGELIIREKIRVEISFTNSQYGRRITNDPFEPVYRSTLINYDVAKNWGISSHPRSHETTDPFEKASMWFKVYTIDEGIYKVSYDDLVSAGMPPTPVQSSSIVMYSYGGDTLSGKIDSTYTEFRPVSVKIVDGGDGYFGSGDYILFYGIPMKNYRSKSEGYKFFEHPYSDTNVYWIGIGGIENGLLIEERDATPSASDPLLSSGTGIFRHEVNLINLGDKGTRWEGELIERGRGQPYKDSTFTFNLPYLESGTSSITVSAVTEMGLSRVIKIYVNGDEVGEVFLVGLSTFTNTYELDNLVPGENTITLRITSNDSTIDEVDRLYLDFFEVKYPSRFVVEGDGSRFYTGDASGRYRVKFSGPNPLFIWDVTDPLHPVELVNWDATNKEFSDSIREFSIYYAALSLKSPLKIKLKSATNLRGIRDVDYVAIIPSSLKGAFSSFRNWLEENMYLYSETESTFVKTGGEVAVVAIEDIYEEFGYGIKDPVAIRNFIKYIYDNSTRKPTYIAFYGDGNYDYKNFTSAGGNLIPPYEPWPIINKNNDTRGAWDDFYGDMDGDGYTDIYMGRVPIRTAGDLSVYIEKVKTYMSGRTMGIWRNRVTLVADDEFGSPTSQHELSWHVAPSDTIYRNYIPRSVEVNTLYLTDIMPVSVRSYVGRKAFINTFNRGGLILNIFSHGNPEQLTHEKIFYLPLDKEYIDCGKKNPFVIIASCKTAAFDRILPPAVISEDWALRPGGSIATLSTTTLSYSYSNASYVRSMFFALRTYDKMPLGCLVMHGKRYSTSGRYYVLIGEPSIMIGYPEVVDTPTVMPDTLVWLERAYVSGSGAISNELILRAYGSLKEKHYISPNGDAITYLLPQRLLFNGRIAQNAGNYEGSFIVPYPADTGTKAKVTLLDPSGEFGIVFNAFPLVIKGTEFLPTDTVGPSIKVFLNGKEVVDTPTVPQKIHLEAQISDPMGVKVGRTGLQAGYGMYAVVGVGDTLDLSDIFEYSLNNDTSGTAYFGVNFRGSGIKRVIIVAQDNRGNFSTWTGYFNVIAGEYLRLEEVYIYPNPVRNYCKIHFTFFINKNATVQASVYTVSGLLIWRSTRHFVDFGYNEIIWNGKDFDGDNLSNGLYILRLDAEGEGGEKECAIKKFIIAR